MAKVSLGQATAQRWSLIGGFAQVTGSESAQRELMGWCLLSVGALAIAGVFGLLLAISRIPGVERAFPWPVQFFGKGLVIHVVFSSVVWFLATLGALVHVATLRVSQGAPRAPVMGAVAQAGVLVSFGLLFLPALLDRGSPSLNNYVPAIVDPIYYVGLLVLAASAALVVARFLISLPGHQGPLEPFGIGALGAGLLYLLALLCFAIAWRAIAGHPPSAGFNEDLFWGGGHVLQFMNVAIMLVCWYVLGGGALGQPLVRPSIFTFAVLGLMLCASPAPAFYAVFDMFSAPQIKAFTNLQYALALPPVAVATLGIATVVKLARGGGRPLPWKDAGFLSLVLSVTSFAIGGLLGLFVDGTDTRTPAHYHLMVAAPTVALMGTVFVFFLPLLNRVAPRIARVRAALLLYAGGQTLAALGQFLAGGHGAPRKAAGAAQGLEATGALVGMTLNGVGALVAVTGGVMFIVIALHVLLKKG